MRRPILTHALMLVAGLALGGLFATLPLPDGLGGGVMPATVCVAPGEAWLDDFDVAGGMTLGDYGGVINGGAPVATFTDPATGLPVRRSIALQARCGHETVGVILSDGRAVVYRFEGFRFVHGVLCQRKPKINAATQSLTDIFAPACALCAGLIPPMNYRTPGD